MLRFVVEGFDGKNVLFINLICDWCYFSTLKITFFTANM